MHRVTCNEMRLDFSVIPVSPLFIPGDQGESRRFARAVHPGSGQVSLYIPASALKGTLRRAAEDVLEGAGLDCCTRENPCSARDVVKSARGAAEIYRALCPACRLFGSQAMRSHVILTDAFPAEAVDPAASRRNEGDETVIDLPFYSTLSLRNFERWQVGLFSLIMSRINLAEVQLGANRSTGMGCITVRYSHVSLLYPGLEPNHKQQELLRTRLHGVGQLMGSDNPYGFVYPDAADTQDLPDSAEFDMGMGVSAVTITAEATDEEPDNDPAHSLIDNILTSQALAWGSYVRAQKVPR